MSEKKEEKKEGKKPEINYRKISFGTRFKTEEEAEAAKKRLDIYDAAINLRVGERTIGGIGIKSIIPKFMADKFKRLNKQIGVRWEIRMVDGFAHYVFCPCPLFRGGLNAKYGYGWFRLANGVQKEFKSLLGYHVPYVFLEDEDANTQKQGGTPPNQAK